MVHKYCCYQSPQCRIYVSRVKRALKSLPLPLLADGDLKIITIKMFIILTTWDIKWPQFIVIYVLNQVAGYDNDQVSL
jgi:hypothetical protein